MTFHEWWHKIGSEKSTEDMAYGANLKELMHMAWETGFREGVHSASDVASQKPDGGGRGK